MNNTMRKMFILTVVNANVVLLGGTAYGIYKDSLSIALFSGVSLILAAAFGGKGFQKMSEIKKK